MTDDGGLYINLWLFGFVGAGAFAAALIHELAHLTLTLSDSYKQLLALDFYFLSHAENKSEATLASPVELFATHIACRACRRLLQGIRDTKAYAPLLASVEDREMRMSEVIPNYLV